MKKVVGIFEDYKYSKHPFKDFILDDLISIGISKENINIVSYSFRESFFKGIHSNEPQEKDEDLEYEETPENKQILKKDDVNYPFIVLKGSLFGAVLGVIIDFLILMLFPSIRSLLQSESPAIVAALGINGFIGGFILGGVFSFLKFESDKIKIMAIVYTENETFLKVKELFHKYKASSISVFRK